MTTIYAKTSDQVLISTVMPRVASNNQNTVRFHVDFDTPWEGYVKSAVFHTSIDPTPYEVLFSSDGNCLIPAEVLVDEAALYIGVRGVKIASGEVKSSTELKYKVLPGTPSTVISDPSPNVYQQLLKENAMLKSRLSELEAGGTVDGSEVIGIRTGADGVTYPTAGDAVRGQIESHSSIIYDNKKNVLHQCGLFFPSVEWELGSILGASYKNRIRTTSYTRAVGDIRATVRDGYLVGVVLYQQNGDTYTQVSDTGWTHGCTVEAAEGRYYKVHICRSDNADMTISESGNVEIVEVVSGSRLDAAYNTAMKNDPTVQKLFDDVYGSIYGNYVRDHEWEQGSYVADSNTQKDRIRTKAGAYYKVLGALSISVNAGYRVGVRLYEPNEDGTYTMLSDSGWRVGAFNVPESKGKYYRICISKADGTTELSASEHTNVSIVDVVNDDSAFKKIEKSIDESVKIISSSSTVKTIAHRGDVKSAPECTEPSYIAARKRGHTIAENDLRISKDGEFVMWHDPTLSKLGNITGIDGFSLYTDMTNFYWHDSKNDVVYSMSGNELVASPLAVSQLTLVNGANYSVADFDLAFLKRMDFGRWYGEDFIGTHILTFAEWVLLCKRLGMDIYVDYKFTYTKEQAEALVRTVRRYGMLRHTSWICNTTMANYIRYYDPSARIGFLTIPTEANVKTYSEYLSGGAVFYDGNAPDVTRESVILGLDAGFDVECYYVAFGNADKEIVFEEYRRLIEIGVQNITTDYYHASEAYDFMLK